MTYLQSISAIGQNVNNLIQNIPLVRLFRIENRIEGRFQQSNDQNTQLYTKSNIITKATEVINDFGSWFILLGMYVMGVMLVKEGLIPTAELFAAVEATSMITIPIIWISSTIASIQRSKEVRKQFEQLTLLNQKPSGQLAFNQPLTHLKIDQLALGYQSQVLASQLSFEMNQQDKVMIVGPSGCGKSSLIKTIIGQQKPLEGTITYNGVDLSQLSDDYLDHIAYVGQENFILKDTLQNNITMFRPLDKQKLNQVIQQAQLENLVNQVGLDYVLDENATSISGGERQRINIARALYHGGELLILDEAFSALDLATTKVIQTHLLQTFPMVISILHKYDQELLSQYNRKVELTRTGLHPY